MSDVSITFAYDMLDPRSVEEARAHNDLVLARPFVLGIEVTVPALANRCSLGNVDPQHAGDRVDQAAIEAALSWPVPAAGSTLVTIRPDLDAVGAMAVFQLRAQHAPLAGAVLDRVGQVATSDRFDHGEWPGCRPLLDDEPSEPSMVAPIAALVSDHSQPLATRVSAMAKWLLTGDVPEEYYRRVAADTDALRTAFAEGTLRVTEHADGRFVLVEGTYPRAIALGYRRAPVVIAVNTAFRFRDGLPHRKITVAQFATGYADLRCAAARLNEREAGWGGSPTIIGSPQGEGSRVATADVLRIVADSLTVAARPTP